MSSSNVSPLQDGAAHILAAALDRDPADRLTFLVEACGEEYALLAEVRGLLAAHEAMPGQFLDEPAAGDPELTAQLVADDVPALDSTEATTPMQPPERPVTSRPSASHYVAELPLPEDLQAWMPQGEYIIECFLGQGGMGAVYKGLQMPLRRPVAIKILTKRQAGEEDDFAFEERFKREAYAMASLTHPHIVQVYDCGDAGEHHLFISMELVEGGDLSDAIKSGACTPEAALKFILQICAGMQVAHERGVVHRDIKPANIFLTKDGRAKVADFGLAKKFNAQSTFVTKVGMGMGTPDYAAPEQYDGIPDLDHRADIYALGVMMYQMLTGRLPRGSTFKTPSQLVGVDARIDDVVAKAMASERDERYQSTAELAADLAAIMAAPSRTVITRTSPAPAKTGPAPRTPSPTSRPPTPKPGMRTGATPVPRRTVTPPKQKPKSGVAGGIIAFVVTLAVVAGGAWLMQKPKQKPTTNPTLSPPVLRSSKTEEGWRPLFTDAEWKQNEPGVREFVNGRVHFSKSNAWKPQPSADGAIRARIQWQKESTYVAARRAADLSYYKAEVVSGNLVVLGYFPLGFGGDKAIVIDKHALPKPLGPGDTMLLELRMEGDRLTVLADGVALIDARDSRLPGPGQWGIGAIDGWIESAEVQSPAPPEPWQNLVADSSLAEQGGGKLKGQTLEFPAGGWMWAKAVCRDGAIRMRAVFTSKRGFALTVRGRGDQARYSARAQDARTVHLYFLHESKTTILRRIALPQPLVEGREYELELRIVGSLLTVVLDGTQIASLEEATVSEPGRFGAGTYGQPDGAFQSLEFLNLDPPAAAAAPAPAADGWHNLLAPLTPELVAQTGNGWSLKNGALFSPAANLAALPLPGKWSGTSYQVRVKLRQLTDKDAFHLVVPVADRMCGFELEGGRNSGSSYTGLVKANGKWGKDLPGAVEGKQVKDTEPHDLEVTVRLDGANVTITTTLDTRPLYAWTGLTAALSQHSGWAATGPGTLALGSCSAGWVVSEVKVKRLDK